MKSCDGAMMNIYIMKKLYAAVIETAGQCLYYGDGLAAPLFIRSAPG